MAVRVSRDVRMEAERGILEDALLLVLKMGEKATNQGMWVASRCQKRYRNRFSPRGSSGNAAHPTLDFRFSDLQKYKRIYLCVLSHYVCGNLFQ